MTSRGKIIICLEVAISILIGIAIVYPNLQEKNNWENKAEKVFYQTNTAREKAEAAEKKIDDNHKKIIALEQKNQDIANKIHVDGIKVNEDGTSAAITVRNNSKYEVTSFKLLLGYGEDENNISDVKTVEPDKKIAPGSTTIVTDTDICRYGVIVGYAYDAKGDIK